MRNKVYHHRVSAANQTPPLVQRGFWKWPVSSACAGTHCQPPPNSPVGRKKSVKRVQTKKRLPHFKAIVVQFAILQLKESTVVLSCPIWKYFAQLLWLQCDTFITHNATLHMIPTTAIKEKKLFQLIHFVCKMWNLRPISQYLCPRACLNLWLPLQSSHGPTCFPNLQRSALKF